MISSDKNPIRGQETALTFQFCTVVLNQPSKIFMYSSVMNAVIKLLLSQQK